MTQVIWPVPHGSPPYFPPIVVNPAIQRLTTKDLDDIRQIVAEEIERAKERSC